MVCNKCGRCCRFFDFTAEGIPSVDEDTRAYFKAHNVQLIQQEGSLKFRVWNKCENLQDDNTCRIFDTRPAICRNSAAYPSTVKIVGCGDLPEGFKGEDVDDGWRDRKAFPQERKATRV